MTDRWTLTAAGEVFTFTRNPTTMTTPHIARKTTSFVTSPIDNRIRAARLADTPQEWSFSGKIIDLAQYNELARWCRLPRFVLLKDHRDRVWRVRLSQFEATPLRPKGGRVLDDEVRYHRWQYTVHALMYGRVS